MRHPPISAHLAESEQALRLVLSDLKKIRRDSARLLTAVSEDTSEAGIKLQANVAQFVERLSDVSSLVKADAKQSLHELDAQVKEHPYRSMALTFGIGLLVGAVVSR